MKKGLTVLALVAAVAVGAGGLYGYQQFSAMSAAKAINRTGMVLVDNKRSDSGDEPFILEAKVASETSSELVVNFKYFMSDTVTGNYDVSIHPDMSDWAYSPTPLHPGMNTATMKVFFSPQKPMTLKAESKLLYIYINRGENNVWKGKVFDRTVEFPKVWMK
jgi:hypothetical protein